MIFSSILCLSLAAFFSLSSCFGPGGGENPSNDTIINTDEFRPEDENAVSEIVVDENPYNYEFKDSTKSEDEESETFIYEDEDENTASFTITYKSGTEYAYSVDGNTLTFSKIEEKSEYTISGLFYGNIIIDSTSSDGEENKFTLNFSDFTIYSFDECPVDIEAGDKVTLSFKSGTENNIVDMRDEVGDDDIPAALYAKCDLDIQGKGVLNVYSANNNGIHTKDDLDIKNLTLQVECEDNCLKGNDSLTIESGSYTLIARTGDGLKTSNSDISSKGNQRGTIEIDSGNLLIYAACDGIDASYDVILGGDKDTPDIKIYTDKYSKYSEEVSYVEDGTYYVRATTASYKYSIKYYNSDTDYVWYNSDSYTRAAQSSQSSNMRPGSQSASYYYYYPITKPGGYTYFQVYMYSSSQTQGSETCVACSTGETINSNYDTIKIRSYSNGILSFDMGTYTTQSSSHASMGGMGMGGNDSNTDKGDHSTKGIKADNAIYVNDVELLVSSYDDSIHANGGETLENDETSLGIIEINGGDMTLSTNDDGIHADTSLTISGGMITVSGCYEGLEGGQVIIEGGDISVTSSDDGVNGTNTSGESIQILGGTLYVYASGDGLDSNSKTSYDGILIAGGRTVTISTGSADSSIDNENGYKFTGGYILGIGKSGGMSSESTKTNEFSKYGTSKTISLSAGAYLCVDNYVLVKMPVTLSSYVVFLGDKSGVSIKSAVSSSESFDDNGVCWLV